MRHTNRNRPKTMVVQQRPRRSFVRRFLVYSLLAFVVGGNIALAALLIALNSWIANGNLPNVLDIMESRKPDVVTRIYGIDGVDEHDVEIGRIFRRLTTLVPPNDSPTELELSIIAAEDANFENHYGVDPLAMIKSLYTLFTTGRGRGASTITMQLVKNYVGDNERTLKRKVREMYLAYQLEKQLAAREGSRKATKMRILRAYINQIYVGHGRYGYEEAARFYFNTSAAKLTKLQASALAALAKGAEKYTVMSGSRDEIARSYQALRRRTDYVLRRRFELHTLTLAEYQSLKRETIVFTPPRYEPGVCAEYVALIEKELRSMYGTEQTTTALEVRTSCVIGIQREARRLFEEHLSTIDDANGTRIGRPQGTLAIVENGTGRIIALIGGDRYQAGGLVRALEAAQPPGSAAKMLLYFVALEQGYLPTDYFFDGPTTIMPLRSGGKPWQPKNAHDSSNDWKTLREAYAKSLNTIAAQLIYDMGQTAGDPFAGINAMKKMAMRLNFSRPVVEEYSAALGVFDVLPIDLVRVAATAANGGEYVEPHIFTHLREVGENPRARWGQKEILHERVTTPEVAYLMWTMQRSVVTSGTGVRAKRYPIPIGLKTGTTQGNERAHVVGGTRKHTVVISVGFDKPSPLGIDRRTGKEIQGASNVPLLLKLISLLNPELPDEGPIVPAALLKLKTVRQEYPLSEKEPHKTIQLPRCATEDDPPEAITEDIYLPEFIPEECPEEVAKQSKPRPRRRYIPPTLQTDTLQTSVPADQGASAAPPATTSETDETIKVVL